jgi:O-antigen ligase
MGGARVGVRSGAARPVSHRFAVTILAFGLFAALINPMQHGPFTTIYSELMVAVGITLAMGMVLFGQSPRGIAVPFSTLPATALVMVLGAQMVLGLGAYHEPIQLAASYVLLAIAAMIAISTLVRELGARAVLTPIAVIVLAATMVNILVAIAQRYELFHWVVDWFVLRPQSLPKGVERLFAGRVYGNLGNPNLFAQSMVLGFLAMCYLGVARNWPRRVMHAFTLSMAFGIALAGSRMGVLAIVAVVLLSIWYVKRAPGQEARIVRNESIALFVVVVLLEFVLWHTGLGPGFSALGRFVGDSALGHYEVRLQLWTQAWEIFLRAPLLGTGFGTYAGEVFANADPEALRPIMSRQAHSLPMELLAETGLLGLACVIGLLTVWVHRVYRAAPSIEAWLATGFVASLLVHSLLEYPLWYLHFLLVFAIGIAIVDKTPWNVAPRAALLLGLPAVLAGLLGVRSVWVDARDLNALASRASDPNAIQSYVVQRQAESERWMEGFFKQSKESATWHPGLVERLDPAFALSRSDRLIRAVPNPATVYSKLIVGWRSGHIDDLPQLLRRTFALYPDDYRVMERTLDDRIFAGEHDLKSLRELMTAARQKN